MPSEPCLIQGPCFDCAEVCDCVEYIFVCDCHYHVAEQTEPNPKLEPEDLRPKRAAEDDVMTDDQYIDDLFTKEPCGYQDTPGFRDFLLDAMAAIGERPRAGDVASMHLAYRAGMEAAPAWTTDRPTEPGEYWLSLPPDPRYPNQPRVREAYVYESTRCMVTLDFEAQNAYEPVLVVGGNDEAGTWPDNSSDILSIQDEKFDGAKWSRRETPADPFEEVVT